MAGTSSPAELERDLRQRLAGIDLVCQADLPVEHLDLAESECRTAFDNGVGDRLGSARPATLVVYVAMRGAERYEGNAMWLQLGVESASWRIGQAFLAGLRKLGLPDFQAMVEAEQARTYVAPILVHGGLAAEHAPVLVERLTTELRRGLVDGDEAVRRIAADPGTLRRPVQRLIKYAPGYAAGLFDSLVDHITGRGAIGSALPRHIATALEADSSRAPRGLRRLGVPAVLFDPWGGFGPEVLGPEHGPSWTLSHDGLTRNLAPGDIVTAEPADRLTARSQGHHRMLWDRPVLWFTDHDHLVPPDRPLPADATLLAPTGWVVRGNDGQALPIVHHGAPLTGRWSHHGATIVDLRGCTSVTATPPESFAAPALRWAVVSGHEPVLRGEPVEGVVTSDGAPVFASMPELHVGPVDRPVPIWYTPAGSTTDHRLFEPSEIQDQALPLTDWLGPGLSAGALELRGQDSRRLALPFAVVPGLEVAGLERPLPPTATASALVSWNTARGGWIVEPITALPGDDRIEVQVPGLPGEPLFVTVPRVRWALRSGSASRLELAAGTIRADVDSLLDDDVVLLVRCGRPARAVLDLLVDGKGAQEGPRISTVDSGGRHHQCAFPLRRYTDTLRMHRNAAVELRLQIDGTSMSTVVCGEPAATLLPNGYRTWAPSRPAAPAQPTTAPWSSVEWIAKAGRRTSPLSELTSREVRRLAEQLAARLRPLDHADVVVTFIAELGRAARTWPPNARIEPGSTTGPGGAEWAAFDAVADELWHLEGIRYRQFAGKPLEEALHSWSMRTAENARRRRTADRQAIELWTLGRMPPVDRLATWQHTPWIGACAPGRLRGWTGVGWLPASLLFQVLVLAGGDHDAGPAIAEAIDLVPDAGLEAVAFLLEATRLVRRLHPFQTADPVMSDDDDQTAGAGPAGPKLAPLRALTGLDQATVTIDGRLLVIRPSTPVAPPTVRISTLDDHAQALLLTTAEGDDLVAALPLDLAGPHRLQVVNACAARVVAAASIELALPPVPESWRPTQPARGNDLSSLDELRCQAQVASVCTAIEAQRLSLAPIDPLFADDEPTAAAAIVSFARSHPSPEALDRLGIAVAPLTVLFSAGLLPTGQTEPTLCQRAPVLWAALAPHDAILWRPLGWPNTSGFAAGTDRYDDVIAFARRRHEPPTTATRPQSVRYDLPRTVVANLRVPRTVEALDRRGLDRTFVDLITATYAALAIDLVSAEATRLLIAAHHVDPGLTTNAVLVGMALHLADSS